MRYRSKPVVVEAMQWEIVNTVEGESGGQMQAKRIVAWVNANGGEARYEPDHPPLEFGHPFPRIAVRTINGWAHAKPGHYVVMGEALFNANENCPPPAGRTLRDFYPCDPETFERRWEPVAASDTPEASAPAPEPVTCGEPSTNPHWAPCDSPAGHTPPCTHPIIPADERAAMEADAALEPSPSAMLAGVHTMPLNLSKEQPVNGAELIAAERERQAVQEGYDAEGDAHYTSGELVSAANAYLSSALCVYAPSNPAAAPTTQEPPVHPHWPWHPDYFKAAPFTDGVTGAIRSLVKAGALIAAEIDRLQAAPAAPPEPQ